MKRAAAASVRVLFWSACVFTLVGWFRSHRAADDWLIRRVDASPDGHGVRDVRLVVRSSNGGVRVAAYWGTLANLGGPANDAEYGRSGITHISLAPQNYPAPDDPASAAAFGDFAIEDGEQPWRFPGGYRFRRVGVIVPYRFLAAALVVIAAARFLRRWRVRLATASTRCAACGYDLRATPDRCPECGAVAADPPASARSPYRRRVGPALHFAWPVVMVAALFMLGLFERSVAIPALPSQTTRDRWAPPGESAWAERWGGQPTSAKPFVETIPGSSVSFTMVPIPGGTFRVGSPDVESDRKPYEGPQVEVTVEPFYMGRYEVTWAEYELFCAGYGHVMQSAVPSRLLAPPGAADAVTYPTPMYYPAVDPMLARMGRGAGFPAVSMSHFMARQYTKWLSRKTGRFYRLATEAEWEYACRAGTTTAYHFGDDPAQLSRYAWTIDNSVLPDGDYGYRAVGQKLPNPWGLYDMHGNVAEWVLDGFEAGHYANLGGGPVTVAQALSWPGRRYPRVIRGGGYESEPEDARSASRFASSKELNRWDAQLPKSPYWDSAAFWVGFRVVAPAHEPSEAEQERYWTETAVDILKVLDQEMMKQKSAAEVVPPYRDR